MGAVKYPEGWRLNIQYPKSKDAMQQRSTLNAQCSALNAQCSMLNGGGAGARTSITPVVHRGERGNGRRFLSRNAGWEEGGLKWRASGRVFPCCNRSETFSVTFYPEVTSARGGISGLTAWTSLP